MNFWTKIGIAALVAVGAVGVIVLDEKVLTPKEEEQKRLARSVFDFKAEDARRISLQQTATNTQFVFERGSATDLWKLVEPQSIRADQDAVANLLSSIQSLSVSQELKGKEAVVKGDAAQAAPFGLDKPRFIAEVKTENGTTHTLRVGSDAQMGTSSGGAFTASQVYVVNPSRPLPFLVGSAVVTALGKSFADFRTRLVTDFKLENVQGIRIQGMDGKTTELIRTAADKNEWAFEGSSKGVPVENNKVMSWLSNLLRARADKIIEPAQLNAVKMLELGLAEPQLTITLSDADKKPINTLKLALQKEGVAVTMADGAVGMLPVPTFGDYKKDASHFRDAKLMREIPWGDVSRFQTSSGKSFQREGYDWYPVTTVAGAVPPSETPKASASPAAVPTRQSDRDAARIYQDLEFLEAEQIVDAPADLKAYGLDAPRSRLKVEFREESKHAPLELLVGQRVEKNEKLVWVKRADGQTVYAIDSAWLTALAALDGQAAPIPGANK